MENEKYPKIILGTDGLYKLFISKGVEVKFESKEDIDEFIKDKNFNISGVEDDRIQNHLFEQKKLIFQTLEYVK